MFTHIHNIRYFYSDIYSYPPQTVYVNKTNLDWSLYPLYGFLCLSSQMQRHVGGELNYICVIDIHVRTPICLIIYTPLWASHYFSISLAFFPCRLIDEKSFFMAHFFRMRKWKGPLLLCFSTRAKIDNQCTNVARHADRYTGWMQEQNSSRWTQIHNTASQESHDSYRHTEWHSPSYSPEDIRSWWLASAEELLQRQREIRTEINSTVS